MIEAASSSSTSVGRSSDKKNGEANVDLHPKFRMEENLEAEKDDCNPMIHMMYEFYFDPYSSKWAFLWTFFSCWLVIGRILEIGFQSIDGPNQYSDRKDRSLYYFMPTREEYWYIYIAFMVPLIFDALGKAITILFVVAADENKFLYRKFTGDKLEQFMFCCDQLGNIPFVINALYVYPHNTSLSQAESVVLTLLELLITGRILRMIKEIPSIKAVRVALVNSIDHLVLPVFFFVVFNITAGVFLYFAEPCYNLDDCAWEDLFQSTYFSIVTMTTTGYGNQIPRYEMGRFVACLIMLFGALFLSMPLAIIGNEYDKAWDDVSREYEERAAAKKELADSKQEAEAILAAGHSGGGEDIASVLPMSQPSNASASVAKHGVDSNTLLEEERDRLTKQQLQDDVVQAEQRARADAERQAEELKAEKQLIQADPAVTAHKKLLEAATLLQNSFRLGKVSTRVIPPNSSTKENSDNGTTISDQIEGQIDSTALDLVASAEVAAPRHITPPMLLQLCEIRSWLPALQYTMRSELDYLNRHSTQKLVASRMLGSAAAAAASGAGAVGTRTSPWGTGRSGSGSGSGSGAQLGRSGSGPGAAGGDGVVVGAGAGRGRRRLSVIGGGRARPDPPMITQPVSVEAAADAYSQTPVDRDRKRVLGEGTVAETRQRNRKHRFKNALSSIDDDDSDADNDGSGSSSSSSSGNSSEVEGNNMGADGHQRKKSKHDADDVDKSVLAARNAFKSRKTLYSRMIKVINPEGLEKLGKLNKSETFYRRMDKVSRDPNSLRSRIWILLELPNSSKEARLLQLMLILLISISIFSLFTQTVVSLSTYGESTTICGQVLQQYCSDKDNFLLDPGCFVMGSNSYGMLLNGTASSKESDHTKLGYDCLNNKCFGEGFNFGSGNSELTCETKNNDDDDAADDNDDSEYYPPFQSKDQLERNYGPPYLFTSREQMMKINPICSRIECKDNTKQYRNVNLLWIVTEFVINIIFTAELALRVIVADSVKGFVQDWMNIFDLLSIVPFYVDLLNAVASTGFSNLDFSILASSPGPIVLVTMRSLKVFRMFKLTRHFTASKILTETAKKIWKQILGMLAFLVFLVILFAILLFEVEAGKECFVGDSNCDVPPAQLATLRIGDRVLLNKDGDVTQFGNVFYGLWFSFVTLTSTGYGDIVPVTNAGQVMSIILMLAGTFYLAMPLTAAASTFYMVHEKHKDKINSQNSSVCPEKDGSAAASSNGGHGTDGGTATQSGSGDDAGVRRGSGTLIGVRDGGDGDGGGGGARGGAGGGAEGGAGRGGRGGHQPDYSGTRRSQHLVLDKKLYKRLKKNVQELFLLQSTISGLFEDLQQPSTRAMPAPILGGERGGAGGGILATSIDDEKMALMERVSLMVVKNRRRREPTDESISGGSRGGGRRGDAEHTSSNEDVSEEEKRSSSDHSDVDVINGTPNRDHGLRGGSADLAAATVPAAVQVYTAISHQVDRLQALLLSIEHDLIRLVILHHRTRKNY